MNDYSFFHRTNIFAHITLGSVALLLGLLALVTPKGGRLHRRVGNYFMLLLCGVILTGFSGYRILQTKTNVPRWPDIAAAVLAVAVVTYFLYYLHQTGMYWSPVIIYSTVGALFLVVSYDLIRYLMLPEDKYRRREGWIVIDLF